MQNSLSSSTIKQSNRQSVHYK